MTTLQFEKVYDRTLICLKKCCTHPSTPIDTKWAWQMGFIQVFYTTGFVSIVYSFSMNLMNRDFSQAYNDAIFMALYLVVTYQSAVVLWYRNPLNTLIQKTEEYFSLADRLPAEHQSLVIEYAKRGRWVMRLWYFSNMTTCALFIIKASVLTLHSLYAGDFQLFLLYDYTLPPALEAVKYRYEVFSFILGLQVFYGLCALRTSVGICPLGPIFILNACAQLELVALEIQTIFEERSERNVAQKLVAIVKNLQNIYSYVKSINKMFKVMYELTLKTSALLMPILLYQVIESVKRGEASVEYMMITYKAVLLCYLPCYYSNLLMDKGELVRLALYDSGWEQHFDKRTRVCLTIMLTVALRPISIRTIFRTVCLDAFTDLCQQSYAIFNLINAMWN